MIIKNEQTDLKLKEFNVKNMHVVCDFDFTLTQKDSISSFNIICENENMPEELRNEVKTLFNFYHPLELNEEIPFSEKYRLMNEWWSKEFGLYQKYKLSESIFEKILKDIDKIKLRDGVLEFFEETNKLDIPVIILSSGVGNVIERLLINNKCNYTNIYLISNFLDFKNGINIGLKDYLIHGLNKNEKSLPNKIYEIIKNRPKSLLFGDTIADSTMTLSDDKNSLKIGFLNEKEERLSIFQNNYDIICTNNTSFFDLKDFFSLK